VRTLGIDLAAQPKNTAVCEIDWATGRVEIEDRALDDDDLVARILMVDKAGIDAPLGWPDAFVAAISAHHASKPWPALPPGSIGDPRRALRYRLTDLYATEVGSRPLSVSSDLIAVPAMRAAELQHRLRQKGATVDRAGLFGLLCETYPAGSLRAWGFPHTGYKRTPNRDALRELATLVLAQCTPLEMSPVATERCRTSDDCLDALLCALTARAVAVHATHLPSGDQLAQVRREGWIHLPSGPLTSLFDG
jgi:predicted nuclease with RNAse H fold